MTREASFATEREMCAAFIAAIDKRIWIPYPETQGWDILLVRKTDGFQIGIQAKLKLNADVINQAIEDGYGAYWSNGPDCRAVLVPWNCTGRLTKIASYIGVTVVRMYPGVNRPRFNPDLPRDGDPSANSTDWFQTCPKKRHSLPEYVPDVPAGASAPVQLTNWKIAAIKIAVTLEKRGFVTRHDFSHIGLDHRRWTAPGNQWLQVENGHFVAGERLPDFKKQHPRVYTEIAADADDWMLKELPMTQMSFKAGSR